MTLSITILFLGSLRKRDRSEVALELLAGACLARRPEDRRHVRPGLCSLVPACTVESAVRDRRLQVALGAAGYGLTRTLAAVPRLVARWEDARVAAPYA